MDFPTDVAREKSALVLSVQADVGQIGTVITFYQSEKKGCRKAGKPLNVRR
jgi:hypothetical protein